MAAASGRLPARANRPRSDPRPPPHDRVPGVRDGGSAAGRHPAGPARQRHFVVGTAIGIIPGTVVYTVLGAWAAEPSDPLFLGAMVALALLAVLGGTILRFDPAGSSGRRAARRQRDGWSYCSAEPGGGCEADPSPRR